MADVLDAFVAGAPGREALVARSGRLTYAQLDAQVTRATAALHALGVRPGDRVAAALSNDAAIVVAFLATMHLGAIWVGVNRALATPEKHYELTDAQASVLLADGPTSHAIGAIRHDLPELGSIVRVEPGGEHDEWSDLLADHEHASPPRDPVDPFAPAAIAYTSGTTGRPKGVVHTQHNLLLPGAFHAFRRTAPEGTRHGVCLPLTILNLIVLGPLCAFQAGWTLVAIDRVDPVGLAGWIARERVETIHLVPTLLHDLLAHPEVSSGALATLRAPGVGGGACPPALRDAYRARFGVPVRSGYGLTEAPTAVTSDDPDGPCSPLLPGSSGRALDFVDVTVRDDDGRIVRTGVTGELCVGPARTGRWSGVYTPMLGYWNRPDATAHALRDGVLHTGDVGYLDGAGNVFVTDRKDRLVVRGGANVAPAEVERVLAAHDAVAACVVLGVDDERLGQRVAAVIELQPGKCADVAALRDHCGRELARYKVPDDVVVVNALPRNSMGKVDQRAARALVERGARLA